VITVKKILKQYNKEKKKQNIGLDDRKDIYWIIGSIF